MAADVGMAKIGRGGHVGPYDVLILRDEVVVSTELESRRYPVPNYGTAIGDFAGRPGFRLALAKLGAEGDEGEILYLYDYDDDWGFGYALNLTDDWCSEWGDSCLVTPETRRQAS